MYLLSLLMGLLSWGTGLAAVLQRDGRWWVFSSVSACALSLFLELWEAKRRAEAEDCSALLDTLPTIALCAAVLVAVTILLNLMALYRSREIR